MTLIAPAKLNLYLHVTGRREDGYHFLESLFVFINFGDIISIKPAKTLSLSIDGPFASKIAHEPIKKNLVYRAALLLKNNHAPTQGAHIVLTKYIPVGAGLGGGSSDAAAILKGLNHFWNLNLKTETLCEIGLSLGADIPACIMEKPAVVSGIGESIKPISLPHTALFVLLIYPNDSLSTQSVFQTYKKTNLSFTSQATKHVAFTDWKSALDHLANNKNELEPAAMTLCPNIQPLLNALKPQPGCKLARMSGSGSACFALFQDIAFAQAATHTMKTLFPSYWIQLTQLLP